MAKPFPLTVYGPVTPLNPAIRVTGVLASADVTILDNGTGIGHAVAGSPGELWVTLTAQPVVGHNITAVQKNAEGISDPSPQPILVIDVPNPLPTPVFISDLNTCMVDIRADALVPGAKVITTIGGTPFGSTTPSDEAWWLGIDGSKFIGAGASADVHQEATIGGSMRMSKTAQSLPIPAFSINSDLLPPAILGPLTQCDTSRAFLQVVSGAGLTLTNEGQSESWNNPANAYNGYGAPPLKLGKAVVTQQMPRCQRRGQPVTLPVGPAQIPGAPVVTQDVCPQAPRLTVSNLSAGGVLHIYRVVNNGPRVAAGDIGIAYPQQPVDLSASLALTDPAGPVTLVLTQSRCAGESLGAVVSVATAKGPFGAPRITEPLFDCARGIPITGAHPGALVTAINAGNGLAMSDPYAVAQANMVIKPWFPLTAGQKLVVRQHGCNAEGDSPVARVNPLPNPLPVPKIVQPVRPAALWVKVTGAIPGARLHLLVNNVVRPGSVDTLTDTAVITVQGAPLAEQDHVFVIQTLCDASSNREGLGASVTRGHLKVSVSPTQVARGTSVPVTVTALDADTGTAVPAQVLLNGKVVGTTGSAFVYAPKLGDPNPAGVVHEPVAYFDAPFSIMLVDPSWTVFLHANPVPVYLDTLQISIDKITWTVTPDWNPALAKTITVSPSAPAATGSEALPVPTGSVKTVTVTIAGTASTPDTTFNGYSIPAQSFAIAGDTRKIAFHGPNEKIAWLLQAQYVADQDTIVFGVVSTFAGIQDA